jgi:hypothetical protein
MKRSALLLLTVVIATATILFIACGGGTGGTRSTTSPSTTASFTTTMSDPTTCSAPQGPFSHVYVTITDVKISTNSNAADNDSSFVDLTPNLKNAPQQVDLLGLANNQCFLATLGANQPLTPGTYQQIRVILADNAVATKPAGNKCGNDANCVQLGADNSIHTLNLSSESQTGIKIPAEQMGGGVQATAGSSQTLNIDFDACASIVIQGNGQYRLKPVLHAGEVSTTASSAVSGKLVDKTTGAAIVGGKAIVALEQKDSTGVDRVILQTVPDSTGAFNFCPVPAGTYDVVAAAVNGAGVAYAATITTGVQPGNSLGNIQMVAQTGASTGPASLTGLVTTASATAGVVADVAVSALQSVVINSTTTLNVTIPMAQQSSATASVTTAATSSALTCPANTDCAKYTLAVPATAPTVGAFVAAGTTYTASTAAASYTVQGHAFLPSSGGKDDCTPPIVTSAAVAASAGASVPVPNLTFASCQ